MPTPVKPTKPMGQFLAENGALPPKPRQGPLWKGPSDSSPLGGITFSMLSRFLVCRERFRLYAIEGLQTKEGWNHRMGYGDMWHVCEEGYAKERGHVPGTSLWEDELRDYTRELCTKHQNQQETIAHWYNVCKIQFPEYKRYWAQYKDVRQITNIEAEKPFCIPYKLASGRTVYLRGKRDSVDLVEAKEIWLQENKTRGDVNEMQLRRQLKFDLQTMLYFMGLLVDSSALADHPGVPVVGVRYNVIRRPLSGGKGTIKQHEATQGAKCPKCKGVAGLSCGKCGGSGRVNAKPAETLQHFYGRLRDDYIVKEPESYFFRWEIPVTIEDVQKFKHTCLDPILEQLCDWYQHIMLTACFGPNADPFGRSGKDAPFVHWRHPFGVYNVLNEGGTSDVDEYLTTGSEVGLRRVEKLFPELAL